MSPRAWGFLAGSLFVVAFTIVTGDPVKAAFASVVLILGLACNQIATDKHRERK